MHHAVAAEAELGLRPGVRGGRIADVRDLVPNGVQHAVALADLDRTLCGRDVERPLSRFVELRFADVPDGQRCPTCVATITGAGSPS